MTFQTVSECKSSEKGCNCGRMAKSRGVLRIISCIESETSRCSCLKNGQACSRHCRCVNCKNAPVLEKPTPPVDHKGCTCGSMRKGDSERAACKDSVERKSRCPCLTGIKRKRNNPDTYKRLKKTD